MAVQILQTQTMAGGEAVVSIPHEGDPPEDLRFVILDRQTNRFYTPDGALTDVRTLIVPPSYDQRDGALRLFIPPAIVDKLLEGEVLRFDIPALGRTGEACRVPDLRPTGGGAAPLDPSFDQGPAAPQPPTNPGGPARGGEPSNGGAAQVIGPDKEEDPSEPAEEIGSKSPDEITDHEPHTTTRPPPPPDPPSDRTRRIVEAFLIGAALGAGGSFYLLTESPFFNGEADNAIVTERRDDELQRLGRQLESADADLAESRTSADALRAQLADRTAALEEVQERIDALEADAEQARGERHVARGDLAETQRAMEELQSRLADAEDAAATARAAEARAQDALRGAQTRAEQLEGAVADLEQRLDVSRRDVGDVAELRDEVERLADQLEEARAANTQAQDALAAARARTVDLEDTIADQEERLAAARQEGDAASSELAELRDEVDRLEGELAAARSAEREARGRLERIPRNAIRERSVTELRDLLSSALARREVDYTPVQMALMVNDLKNTESPCAAVLQERLAANGLGADAYGRICGEIAARER